MRRSLIALLFVLLIVVRAQAGAEVPTNPQYLPLVVRSQQGNETTTPTASPTATSTPVPVILWPNGDFEQGPTIWTMSGSRQDLLITNDPLDPVRPRSGSYVAALIEPLRQDAYITQRGIVVPSDPAYLSYWIWIRSTDQQCGDDQTLIEFAPVVNPLLEVAFTDPIDLCASSQTSGWVNKIQRFDGLAGQAYQFRFYVHSTGNLSDSQLYIDDIGWIATP
jgi:hypothetical protein